jgi:SAM-dependent methyltransferase
MADLYSSPAMVAGYAKARPPVHPRVLELVREDLGITTPLARGLDVGSGAGLSTRALQAIVRECTGVEPSEAMVRIAPTVAPGATFVVGRAESLPVPSGTIDMITAAGSLNYADLNRFYAEAARVLTKSGVVVIYDFTPGRSIPGSPDLDGWFAQFMERYPAPANFGHDVDRDTLSSCGPGLRLSKYRDFEVSLSLTLSAYVDYVLTETNVATAVQKGTSEPEIRAWCTDTLAPVFGGKAQAILFRGYIAYLVRV